MRKFLTACAAVVLCEAAGLLGSVFTIPAIPAWYALLARPPLAPPNWIFGPVWTTLYALMGIAAFLIWEKYRSEKRGRRALMLFCIQLALNILWSFIFFGMRAPVFAAVEIALMWLAIAATIAAFAKLSKPAAWLLAPYLLWVSFAAYLNIAIALLNR